MQLNANGVADSQIFLNMCSFVFNVNFTYVQVHVCLFSGEIGKLCGLWLCTGHVGDNNGLVGCDMGCMSCYSAQAEVLE